MTAKHPGSGGTAAVERTLELLAAIVARRAEQPLSAIARELGLPPSTAYRLAAVLTRHGLVAPGARGYYGPGLTLADIGSFADPRVILAGAARPALRRLAHETGATAHLGVWADDMVTYIVKEGRHGKAMFTREGGQLEAYCSAIGKVLLANIDSHIRDRYLTGQFVPLTRHTIVDAVLIARELSDVARNDFATDRSEIAEGLQCIAVPVRRAGGQTIAAVSISTFGDDTMFVSPPQALMTCAKVIGDRLGGRWNGAEPRINRDQKGEPSSQ